MSGAGRHSEEKQRFVLHVRKSLESPHEQGFKEGKESPSKPVKRARDEAEEGLDAEGAKSKRRKQKAKERQNKQKAKKKMKKKQEHAQPEDKVTGEEGVTFVTENLEGGARSEHDSSELQVVAPGEGKKGSKKQKRSKKRAKAAKHHNTTDHH